MSNKASKAKKFEELEFKDKDLIMFTITDLRLQKNDEQVHMVISLKRKIQTELRMCICMYRVVFFNVPP